MGLLDKIREAELLKQRQAMTHRWMDNTKVSNPQDAKDFARGGLLGLTTDVLGIPFDIANMIYPVPQHMQPAWGTSDAMAQGMGLLSGSKPETAGRMVSGLLSPDFSDLGKLGLLGVTAYHGSPHKFEKFMLDKIGTGEGAQAYGHGLYFAESPEVAEQYRFVKGNQTHDFTAKQAIDRANKKIETLKKQQRAVNPLGLKSDDPFYGNDFDMIQKQIDDEIRFRKIWEDEVAKTALYTVDLPDEHVKNFLDWDKPLSEQPNNIQASLKAFIEKEGGNWEKVKNAKWTGQDFYKRWRGEFADAGMSEDLNKMGIKGIKYLDGMSRSGGKGTSNYVVFDEDIIKILSRE